jgi:hypothetical protein
MIVDIVDPRSVRSALDLATQAPSIHNSQPWHRLLGQCALHLHADSRRWLRATDSSGRGLIVSCGAALHHLRVAVTATGIRRQRTGCRTRTGSITWRPSSSESAVQPRPTSA